MDSFPLFSVLDETRIHYTGARSVVSLTLSAPGPHIITTQMYVHRPPSGVRWSLVSSVLVVTHYCLIFSRSSFLVFSRVVFSSILGDYTRVWVPPVPCSPFPFFCFPYPQCLDEKPLEKEILYKCTLYPFTLPFFPSLLPRFLSLLFLFVITRPYPAQLSRRCSYLCVPSANGSPSCLFLHLSVSRSVVYKVDIPSFLCVRTLTLSRLVSSVCGNIHDRRVSSTEKLYLRAFGGFITRVICGLS